MGRAYTEGFVNAVHQGQITIQAAVAAHLQGNFYPPHPQAMVPVAVAAVQACQAGDPDKVIATPFAHRVYGHNVPATVIVEAFKLWAFLEEEAEEEGDEPCCDGCGLPFSEDEWDERHTEHEPECPARADSEVWCECDLNYHPGCCPDCNPEVEFTKGAPASLLHWRYEPLKKVYTIRDPLDFGTWAWDPSDSRVYLIEAEEEVAAEGGTNGYRALGLDDATRIINKVAGV